MKITFRIFVLVILPVTVSAMLGGSLRTSYGEDDVPKGLAIDHVQVGIGGYFKVGRWTQATITVTTSGAARVQAMIEAQDSDGRLATFGSQKYELAAAGSHVLPVLFQSGRIEGGLEVRIKDDADVLLDTRSLRVSNDSQAELHPALRQSVTLLATLGRPAGFADLEDDRVKVVELESADHLPIRSGGYDSVDVLVVADHYDLNAGQSRALREWVRLGGRLVLSVGSNVADYQTSLLAEWVPVPVEGSLRLRRLSGLESYTGRGERIAVIGRVPAAKVGPVEGNVLIRDLDGPILVILPFGLGQITFLALDLNRPPLSNWPSIEILTRKLIGLEQEGDIQNRSAAGRQLSHSGITDLATQLHATQDYFPKVRRSSRATVLGLLLLYLVFVGPVDYFVVHRLLKKPHLTWVTFPAMVVAAVLLAAWGANSTNGNELRLNQTDVVDIDERSGTVRSQSWITLYSPETRWYDVALRPSPFTLGSPRSGQSLVQPRLSWYGVPEESFGGLYRSGGFEIGRPVYRFGAEASRIENLPIPVWSTGSLTATWHSEQIGAEPLVESSLESSGAGQLSGHISHHLPVPLEDWILAYRSRVYWSESRRGTGRDDVLEPGQPLALGPLASNITQRDLSSFLTGTKATRAASKNDGKGKRVLIEKLAYDPLNRNSFEILRMLTFHQAAGGKSYTGLENNVLGRLDFSGLLRLNRAVLFGRIDLAAARVELDGETVEPNRQATFVRIVLPVKQSGTILRNLPKMKED